MKFPVELPDFASPPRVIVLDLDGTLLDPDGVLRPRSREAVEAILNRGLPVVIATARPLRSVRTRIGAGLLERVALIPMNGGAMQHAGSAPLSIARLPTDAAQRVVALAAAHAPGARVVCEMDGESFGCDMPLDAEALWSVNSATPEMVVPLAEAFVRGATKLAINGLGASLADLVQRLRVELSSSIDVIPDGSGTFANIVPVGVSKHAALSRLLGSAEPWTGMLAFGDDISDIEVLRRAEYGVAVANALPEVLRAGRYSTYSNAEEGVAHVLERVVALPG